MYDMLSNYLWYNWSSFVQFFFQKESISVSYNILVLKILPAPDERGGRGGLVRSRD